MRFYLGTHEVSWLEKTDVPLFISRRRLWKRKRLPRAIGAWALDSGGFTELSMYGEWRTPLEQYVDEVERFHEGVGGMEWAAPQDWMCEPWIIEKTGKTVEEHQWRTVENYLQLKAVAPHLPFVPVLQGWTFDEYVIHAQMYLGSGVDLRRLPLVGIGSVCRRQQTEGGQEVIEHFTREGVRLHAFGLKNNGLRSIGSHIESSDSLAWSYNARRNPPLPHCTHRRCSNCILWALRWRERLIATLEHYGVHVEPEGRSDWTSYITEKGSGMTKTVSTEGEKYVRINNSGVADARRFHLFKDCSTLRGAEDVDLETISDREAKLLGVSVCSVCEKRKSGGPAIDALEGFFGEDWPNQDDGPRDLAWKLVDYLRERNIYLAQRGARTETAEETEDAKSE